MSKKTIGIVCDLYKLDKFKTELNKKGFTDLTITVGPLCTIKVHSDSDTAIKDVSILCHEVELHFKQSN